MRTTYAGALLALLAACGTATDDDGEVSGTEPEATGAFPHADYTFVYSHTCFCPDRGVPIEVTVADGEAVRARYAGDGPRQPSGPASGDWHLITIDDVIALTERKDVAHVEVEWPTGQEYPTSVWIDEDELTVDEEFGYTILRVDVAD